MVKRKNFRWRYQPVFNSPAETLLSYLQDSQTHPSFNTTQMILEALSAYYMPLAYSVREKQEEKLKQVAYDSVFSLLRQVDRLVCQFQLDVSKLGVGSEVVNQKLNQDLKNRKEVVTAAEVVEDQDSVQEIEPEEKFNFTGLLALTSQDK